MENTEQQKTSDAELPQVMRLNKKLGISDISEVMDEIDAAAETGLYAVSAKAGEIAAAKDALAASIALTPLSAMLSGADLSDPATTASMGDLSEMVATGKSIITRVYRDISAASFI